MYKTTAKIEGMMCGMCETHISEAIRKAIPEAKKVSASRKKKEASFLTEGKPDLGVLEAAVKETGYDYISADTEEYTKHGLFG